MLSLTQAPGRRPATFANLVRLCVSGPQFDDAYLRVACFSQRLLGDVPRGPGLARLFESSRAPQITCVALPARLSPPVPEVLLSCAARHAHSPATLSILSPAPAARPNCAQLS